MNVFIQQLIAFGTLINIAYHFLFPHVAFAGVPDTLFVFEYDRELAIRYQEEKERLASLERMKQSANVRYHVITAYSSTVWQTDSSPFITAAGTHVRDGIVAANTLPFGTKIMIPDLFGDKVFTVEDRMAPKNHHKIDIWFPTTYEARQFGVKKAQVLVLADAA